MALLTEGPASDRSPEVGDPGSPTVTRPADAGGPLRQMVLRMHFFAGLFVGPFLLVAALSGFFYALAPTAEKIVYHDQLTASGPAQSVSPADQVAAARAVHPRLPVSGIVPGVDGSTTRVLFRDPSLPGKSYSRVVFVDPADGSIRGDSVQYGGSQALPLRTWLSNLHRNLHLGEPGRLYSELAASWLAPVALGGLYLWWGRRRGDVRALIRSRPGLSGRAVHRERHAVLGTWALLGMLVLSLTGLTWSTYAGQRVGDLWTALDWRTPTLSAAPVAAVPTATNTDPMADLDRVLGSARRNGLQDPLRLTPPSEPGQPWQVKETRYEWTVGADSASIDGATGRVVESLPFSSYPFGAKLTDWGIRVHMGMLFGFANQIVMAALAGAITVVTIRGYIMWWMRRPTRRRGLPRPPVRGALRECVRRRPATTALTAMAITAVGWAVPLFGVSLAAFVVIDVLGGILRSGQRGHEAGSTHWN